MAQSLLAYGHFLAEEDESEARRTLESALAVFNEIGASGWIEETRVVLATLPRQGAR